jgi:hypothetical protein
LASTIVSEADAVWRFTYTKQPALLDRIANSCIGRLVIKRDRPSDRPDHVPWRWLGFSHVR